MAIVPIGKESVGYRTLQSSPSNDLADLFARSNPQRDGWWTRVGRIFRRTFLGPVNDYQPIRVPRPADRNAGVSHPWMTNHPVTCRCSGCTQAATQADYMWSSRHGRWVPPLAPETDAQRHRRLERVNGTDRIWLVTACHCQNCITEAASLGYFWSAEGERFYRASLPHPVETCPCEICRVVRMEQRVALAKSILSPAPKPAPEPQYTPVHSWMDRE